MLLSPVDPPIIFGFGINYRKHAAECGLDIPNNPVYFICPADCRQHPGRAIEIPECSIRPEVDFECELAIIIGKAGRDIPVDKAYDHVLGYTAANDVSARKWQVTKELCSGQWNRGKGFDTFKPLGPAMVLHERGFDPHSLDIKTVLNGETVQDSNTNDFIWSVAELVSFLSQGTTIRPGTVVLTGTPEGIGHFRDPPLYMHDGDVVEVYLEGVGWLRNAVRDEFQTAKLN